jgi:hypothetical protein
MVVKKSAKSTGKPKSTQAQVVEKKIWESKPSVENQQESESKKLHWINWDVVGLSTAAITLLGAGFLFMLGWAYEANWYGYFGVSINQVSISLQQILVQSLPSLFGVIFSLVYGVLFVYVLVSTTRIILFSKKGNLKTRKVNAFIKNKSNYWMFMLGFATVLLTAQTFFFIMYGIFSTDRDILTILANLLTAIQTIETQYLFQLFSLFFLVLIIILFLNIFAKRRKVQLHQGNIFRSVMTVTLPFLYLASAIAFSSQRARFDAEYGSRSGGWHIQQSFILSDKKIKLPANLIQAEKNPVYAYGPFGLIGQDDNSLILIEWKNDSLIFKQNPGLYIFPREGLIIIPANDPSLTFAIPSVTATDTPQPMPTLTVMPKPTKTVTPISITATSQP